MKLFVCIVALGFEFCFECLLVLAAALLGDWSNAGQKFRSRISHTIAT